MPARIALALGSGGARDASQSALTRYSLAAHTPDVLITVPKDACRTTDFHKAAELIDLGRELARQALDQVHPENA